MFQPMDNFDMAEQESLAKIKKISGDMNVRNKEGLTDEQLEEYDQDPDAYILIEDMRDQMNYLKEKLGN